ncbi:MAG: adenylosuccinate synthase [Bacteroidales bacterium]|nr:adenylosuccinate synthase [Bacteroidales bacterium]
MSVDVLLGLQWGDEGKGKIVDVLTPKYDVIARFQGGPNAGHTIIFQNQKFVLHSIPSGIFYPEKINIIGNGAILDPNIFMEEVKSLTEHAINVSNNLKISKKTHLILPTHRLLDAVYEQAKGAAKIGSTLKGIGPTYTDKISRVGLRVGDILSVDFKEKYQKLKDIHLKMAHDHSSDFSNFKFDGKTLQEYETCWFAAIEQMKTFEFIDSEIVINKLPQQGKKVLAEGAQGSLLDVDFGSYPFVTSSNTTISGVCSGLGIAPSHIGKVFGIVKAYCTRVGSGPFPTELFDATGETLRRQGGEFGATTGRARRCGWLDLPALKYSVMLNGVTDLIITKPDVMNNFETIYVCTHYQKAGKTFDLMPYDCEGVIPVLEQHEGWNTDLNVSAFELLPEKFKKYVSYIEQQTGVTVSIVSTGADRLQTLFR